MLRVDWRGTTYYVVCSPSLSPFSLYRFSTAFGIIEWFIAYTSGQPSTVRILIIEPLHSFFQLRQSFVTRLCYKVVYSSPATDLCVTHLPSRLIIGTYHNLSCLVLSWKQSNFGVLFPKFSNSERTNAAKYDFSSVCWSSNPHPFKESRQKRIQYWITATGPGQNT